SVLPRERVLSRKGDKLPIRVLARYSDGSARDVTDLARYSSYDEGVASVDDNGLVTALRGGESAVMAAYAGFVKVSNVVVPVGDRPIREAPPSTEALQVCGNWIDDLVLDKLKQLRI